MYKQCACTTESTSSPFDVANTLPYSGKFPYGANFRIFCMSVLYVQSKTYKDLNDQEFCVNKTLPHNMQ